MNGLTAAEIETALTAILPEGVAMDSIVPVILDVESITFDPAVFFYGNVRVSGKKSDKVNAATFYGGEAIPARINLYAYNLPEKSGYYQNVLFSQVATKDANVIFEGYKITCSGGGIDDSDGGVLDI